MDPVNSFLIGNIQNNVALNESDSDPDDLFYRSLVATSKVACHKRKLKWQSSKFNNYCLTLKMKTSVV